MNLSVFSFFVLIPISIFSQIFERISDLPYELEEASGMVYLDANNEGTNNGLFMLEDSKKPYIYKVCEISGKIKQVIKIDGAQFKDKETLTADDHYLYIGDIGDNKGKRKSLQIVRIPLAELIPGLDTVRVKGETITLEILGKQKPNKKKHNIHDFEAMIVKDDSIYLFSKRRKDYKTVMYALPNELGHQVAYPTCEFDTKGLITGAALNPETKELVLIGYQRKKKNPYLIYFSNFDICDAASRPKFISLTNDALSFQVESVTFYKNNQLLFSNEWTKDVPQGIFSFLLPTN